MLRGTRHEHDAHGEFQVFALHRVAERERCTRAGRELRKEISPVPLYAECHGGGGEFARLRFAEADVAEARPRDGDDIPKHGEVLFPKIRGGTEMPAHDLAAGAGRSQSWQRYDETDAIEQVGARRTLGGVEGGHQAQAAGAA